MMSKDSTAKEPRLTGKQKMFADRYLSNFMNATEAAIYAYGYDYDTASSKGSQSLRNVRVSAYIKYHTQKQAMDRDEWLRLQAEIIRFDMAQYVKRDGNRYYIDIELLKKDGYGYMLDGIDYSQTGESKAAFLSREKAFDRLGKALGITTNQKVEVAGDLDAPMQIVVEYVNRQIDANATS